MGRIEYVLDPDGVIIEISGDWDEFALANDAPELLRDKVIGTRLEDHIADAETRHFLSQLLARVRVTGRPLDAPYRCDSPEQARAMNFHAEPAAGGSVKVVSTLLEVKEYHPSVLALYRHASHDTVLFRVCSWCKRLMIPEPGEERWAELEEAASDYGLLAEPVPRITHGICPECARTVLGEDEGLAPSA